jgi:hypothetical protein
LQPLEASALQREALDVYWSHPLRPETPDD